MATGQYERERQLQREVSRLVESSVPGAEVLALEITGKERFCVYVDHPEGVDHALCERVTMLLRPYLDDYSVEVSSPGIERPLRKRSHFERAVGQERPAEDRGAPVQGRDRRGRRTGRADSKRLGTGRHSIRPDRAGELDRRRVGQGMSQEIVDAVRDIEREKGIESGTLVAALEDALLAAYKKTPGASRHATVELDDKGDFRVFAIELPLDLETRLLDEARERALDELERLEEETGEKNHTLLSDDDLEIDLTDVSEDVIDRQDVTPQNFGRIAAQTAKQVILQRIREAEREMMYDEYIDRVGEVVTGIVQQTGDRRNILVDLGKVEALLPGPEQVDGERYEQGSRIKAVIREVRTGTKGPQVILSRRDPELIKTLFELEVPEIADGLVEIRGVAREPGYRSKIAVESHAQGVDPVGACVGPRGSRVRMVVSELRGEKIDIIPWNNEPARFVAKALSPARVREVYLDDEAREATVVVPDDQLALAIGKEGMNARLAARLTGWKVDIVSDSEFAQQEADAAYGGDGEDGGRRLRPLRAPFSRTASAARTRRCPARSTAACPRTRRSRARRARSSSDVPDRGRSRAEEIEAVVGRPSSSPRTKSRLHLRSRLPSPPRSRRKASVAASTRDDQDVRRLRPQGAPGRAAALPRGARASSFPGAGRGRGVYTCRRLSCFERAAHATRVRADAPADRPRRPDRSHRLYTGH